MSYSLGPYFTEINVGEIVQGPSFFTLHFDETNNEVRVKYLTLAMFGHAKAVNVVKEMLTALEELGIH